MSKNPNPIELLQLVPLDEIKLAIQPRITPTEEALDELATSMAERGLIQPISIYPVEEGFYRIQAGERRYLAAISLGWTEIPAVIVARPAYRDFLATAVIENEQRVELSSIEKAWALRLYYLGAQIEAIYAKYGSNLPAERQGGMEELVERTLRAGADLRDNVDRSQANRQRLSELFETELRSLLQKLNLGTLEEWSSSTPLVSWATILDRIGLRVSQERRRQIMTVLNIDTDLQLMVSLSGMSDAAARALAKLPPHVQKTLVKDAGARLGSLSAGDVAAMAEEIINGVSEGAKKKEGKKADKKPKNQKRSEPEDEEEGARQQGQPAGSGQQGVPDDESGDESVESRQPAGSGQQGQPDDEPAGAVQPAGAGQQGQPAGVAGVINSVDSITGQVEAALEWFQRIWEEELDEDEKDEVTDAVDKLSDTVKLLLNLTQ